MKKKVLILGASRYYINSITTAKKIGYYTIVVDKNPNSYGFPYADEFKVIDIRDYSQVCDLAEKKYIDGIVALNDFGVLTAAYVSTKLNLPGIKPAIAEIATNKVKMRNKWKELTLPNPNFEIVCSSDECLKAAHSIGYPVILKPAESGGGSRGVIVINEEKDLLNGYNFACGFDPHEIILVEELLIGLEHSAEIIIYNGEYNILAISDKIKTPYPSRVDKNVIYPTIFEGRQLEYLKRIIIEAVKPLNITNGCIHIECCTLPSGEVKLFEFGARPGGGGTPDPIVTFVTGINEIEQYLKLSVGDSLSLILNEDLKACNYHFITPPAGHVKSISGFEKIRSNKAVLDAELFIKPDDHINKVKIGSDRSGFIIVGSDTREEALEIGYNLESEIDIKYY